MHATASDEAHFHDIKWNKPDTKASHYVIIYNKLKNKQIYKIKK